MDKVLTDVYDEEFKTNIALAKTLALKLNTNDKLIFKKWISKLCALRSTDPIAKKNRNHFLQYFLQILDRATKSQESSNQEQPPKVETEKCGGGFMSRWSNDKKTYVAVQPLPGKGALIYMAVSRDPTLGWDMSIKS